MGEFNFGQKFYIKNRVEQK